ncbi:MAG: ATP-binding protein [candidate division Zixibacteria bacterium]|nr:ATP-binding protein [candidate division Zixibacteria bacterium]
MRRKQLIWRLYPWFLIIAVAVVVVVTVYSSLTLRRFYLTQTADDLKARIEMVKDEFVALLTTEEYPRIEEVCRHLEQSSGTRMTIVLTSGKVVGDSERNPDSMDNHGDRREVIEALSTGRGEAVRFSYTLQRDMMYVAAPLTHEGKTIGIIRGSLPLSRLDETLHSAYHKIALGGAAAVVLAAIASLIAARRIRRPLDTLRLGADRFARGELTNPIATSDVAEIGRVAEAMNHMARQLHDHIEEILRQRNEQEAVLASMVEGVVAVDREERIISLNQAARRMFAVASEDVSGRFLHEIIRNSDLHRFVGQVLSGDGPAERELVAGGREERYFQVQGSILRDAADKAIGAVVVLNDITRLRRLEVVRRDFVANVSHELKTPVTSIKGFAETLLEGSVTDPAELRNFLGIILRQTDRLNAIIDDLLTLSQVEQEQERAEVALAQVPLGGVIATAMEVCAYKADRKGIRLETAGNMETNAAINPPLLEQALVNLIDNAINYSEAGKTVVVEVAQTAEETIIRVIDQGVGISSEHLPRLFERFYRVDRARSRTAGGTGLGLSIVKHIVQIHGGKVEVASTIGKGSTFSIHLPRGSVKS